MYPRVGAQVCVLKGVKVLKHNSIQVTLTRRKQAVFEFRTGCKL